MRTQDDRSQQSSLSLCDQDGGIRQSRRKIPHSDCSLQKTFNSYVSCQKHWRSPTRLERRTEDVPRWLLLPLHEARIRVDRGIVGCEEHIEISNMILGLQRYV